MDINIARLITQALSKNLPLNQRTGVGEDDSVDKNQQKGGPHTERLNKAL